MKPARSVAVLASELRIGNNIRHEHLTGRVTRIERGPWTGVYLDGDPFRWLIHSGTPVTITAAA